VESPYFLDELVCGRRSPVAAENNLISGFLWIPDS
jgi:hypothetical protein